MKLQENQVSTMSSARQWVLPIVAILGVLLSFGSWALASPLGASPDDDFHLASIWCGLGERAGICESGSTTGTRIVPSALNATICYAGNPTQSAACQATLGIFSGSEMKETARGSFSSNYPPLYYATMSLFVGEDIQTSAIIMRMLNVLLFAAGNILLWLLLPTGLRRTLMWMWAVTTVPLGLFIIASNNPSSWAIMGIGMSWLALFGFLRTSGRRKAALGLIYAVQAISAAGARADAGIFVIFSSFLVVFVLWANIKKSLVSGLLPLGVSVIAFLFFELSQQSAVAVTGLDDFVSPSPRTPLSVLAVNVLQIPQLWTGAFGTWSLGWLDTSMPAVVWVVAGSIFVTTVFVVSKNTSRRPFWASIGVVGVLYFLPLYILQKGLNHVGEQVQPRYLLPLIVLGAGLVFLGVEKRQLPLSRARIFTVFFGLAIANSVALYVNLKRYVSGIGAGTGFSLNEKVQWWWNIPLSPMAIWMLGSVSFFVALVVVEYLTRTGDDQSAKALDYPTTAQL